MKKNTLQLANPFFHNTCHFQKKTEDRNQVLCFCAKSSGFALTEIWFDSIWLLVESTWSAWRQALVVLYELFKYLHTYINIFWILEMSKRCWFGRGIKYYVGKKLQCLKVELVCSLQKKNAISKKNSLLMTLRKIQLFF